MRTRLYTPADRERVLELQHRHGDHYEHHDPDDPSIVSCLLLEDDDGALVGALYGIATVESLLLLDNERGSRAERWRYARMLIELGLRHAFNLGLGQAHFWVPTQLERYTRLLSTVPGLRREDRHSYTVDLKERYIG